MGIHLYGRTWKFEAARSATLDLVLVSVYGPVRRTHASRAHRIWQNVSSHNIEAFHALKFERARPAAEGGPISRNPTLWRWICSEVLRQHFRREVSTRPPGTGGRRVWNGASKHGIRPFPILKFRRARPAAEGAPNPTLSHWI